MLILEDKQLVALKGEELVCDIETYQNFFLICFYHHETKSGVYFTGLDFNKKKLRWILQNFTIVTFNGKHFDNPIILYSLLVNDINENDVYNLAQSLISGELRAWNIYKQIGKMQVDAVAMNDIDLIELIPLRPSLKMCAGRIHSEELEDLPYHHTTVLDDDMKNEVLSYCWKDCKSTALLREVLSEPIKLRTAMSHQYGIDLRSKSDAQVGEAVLRRELELKHNILCRVPDYKAGYSFKYNKPKYINFESKVMQDTLELIVNENFILGESRKVDLPHSIKKLNIQMGISQYNIGIGGLHSCESKITHLECEDYMIVDRDVASYYPAIIRNNRYYQKHIGPQFLDAYGGIVDRRLEAKATGDKSTADSLKISINGSYGKFGSPYSFLYSPELLIHTTLTGQLCMLMLIERLEIAGFSVLSANTDGIVTKVLRKNKELFDQICDQWSKETKFVLEETLYKAVYSRDVNNYIAVKTDGSIKSIGTYKPRFSVNKNGETEFILNKNPNGQIINEAVMEYLTKGTPVEETIRNCKDIRKFIFVRKVKGGCIDKERNKYGKVIRWYYRKGRFTSLYDSVSGNKVATTDGAQPYMNIDVDLPDDICYVTYFAMAKKIINNDFSKQEQIGLFDGF